MSARVGESGGGEEAGGCIGTLLSGIVKGDEKREGMNDKNVKLTERKGHVLPCATMRHVEEQRMQHDCLQKWCLPEHVANVEPMSSDVVQQCCDMGGWSQGP